MRADDIAHVLNKTQYGNVHHGSHIASLADDHGYEILGSRYHDDTVDGKGLEYRKRHITRSGRHIDKKDIERAPVDISPELSYKT